MKTASEARDNESKPMLSREATNETPERRRPTTPTGENLWGNGLLGGSGVRLFLASLQSGSGK